MLKDVFKAGMLFDFYSSMLSERQRQAASLYYFENLSLGEIGKEMNITRQGAYDLIKTGEKIVLNLESKLNLVEKFMSQREILDTLKKELEDRPIDDKAPLLKLVEALESSIND